MVGSDRTNQIAPINEFMGSDISFTYKSGKKNNRGCKPHRSFHVLF